MTTAQEAVAGLLETLSTPLDRNDLGRLARMHTWCQDLAEAESAGTSPESHEAVCRMARGMVLLLERVILDEAADALGAVALIPEAVHAIERAQSGVVLETDALLARMSVAVGGPAPVAPRSPAAPPRAAPVVAAPRVVAPVSPSPRVAPAVPAASAPAGPVVAQPEVYVSEPLLLDMGEVEHLRGFVDEAAEHMDAIEAGLLQVEADPQNPDIINELFRPFHTIKGIAGFLNLRDINRLTHEVETILDKGRRGELAITTGTTDLIFAALDALKAQVNAIRQHLAGSGGGPCPQPNIVAIMGELRRATCGAPPAAATVPVPQARLRLGEILVADGVAAGTDVSAGLAVQADELPPARLIGEILVDEGVTTPARVQRALVEQATGKGSGLDTSIRVDTTKLDALVDTVGELVIAQSMVGTSETVRGDQRLLRNVSQVTKIVRDIQETAMAMRMVPIGQTFQKMRRLVRDVAQKAGRKVELVISGEETELDKHVIQQISDPLVHMVRNAVDHGIEPPEVRRRAGKPDEGRIQLNAHHQGDSIVIEVRDDGQGLDRRKLIAKGVERGMIAADEQCTDEQVYALVMQAGFSTAEKVTDISGRGVGMDVVRRNIEMLRGKIEIESQLGQGSVFRVRLPLTLAIIDGMLVRLGRERVVIPTILIQESLRPERKQIMTVQRRGEMLFVRGELYPLLQLGELFGYNGAIDPCAHLVVIVQCELQRIALVVEELIGQQQVVIKTLGARFKHAHGVSGAAILGDGRVGLILEPAGLLTLHNRMSGVRRAVEVAAVPADAGLFGDAEPSNECDAADAAEPVAASV